MEAGQKVQPVSTSVERIAAADTKGAHLKWMFVLTVILVKEKQLENSKTDHAGDPFFGLYITITPGDMIRLDSMIRCALKCQLQSRWWINKMKKVKSKTKKRPKLVCISNCAGFLGKSFSESKQNDYIFSITQSQCVQGTKHATVHNPETIPVETECSFVLWVYFHMKAQGYHLVKWMITWLETCIVLKHGQRFQTSHFSQVGIKFSTTWRSDCGCVWVMRLNWEDMLHHLTKSTESEQSRVLLKQCKHSGELECWSIKQTVGSFQQISTKMFIVKGERKLN